MKMFATQGQRLGFKNEGFLYWLTGGDLKWGSHLPILGKILFNE